MTVNAQMKQLDDELGDLCEQISGLQRLSGDGLKGDELTEHEQHCSMLDQIHQILRSQLDTLVWVDKQSELFHCSLRPALGHLVAFLLQLFASDSDVNLRLKSGQFLCRITQLEFADESADFIAFVLPGIFFRCRQILFNTLPNLHSLDLVRCSCKLITNAICVSFSKIGTNRTNVLVGKCAKSPSFENVLSFRRDSNWVEMATQRIFPQVASLLSHLSSHCIDTFRFESLNVLAEIRQQIPSDLFGSHFERMTIDLAILLYNDTMPNTCDLAHRLIEDVRRQQNELFELHTLDKLKKTIRSLESDVKKASDGAVYFQKFVNCVQIYGPNLLNRLFNLSEFVGKFLPPVIRLISVDHSKEMICDSFDQKADGLPNLPPLKYGLSAKHFADLAILLVETQNSEKLFDWCFDNFRFDCSAERRFSIAYFSFFLLNAPKEGHQSTDLFMADVLKMLASMESLFEDKVLDHQISNSSVVNSTESSLAQFVRGLFILLLLCLSTFRHQSGHMFSARLHVDVIYELLKWCSSSNFCVKNSAEFALSRIAASHAHPNICSLIQCHAQQIVFKLSIDSLCPRFPLIFAEMVSKCSAHQLILPQIRSVVPELLFWLDHSDQRRIILLAKAFRAYTNALNEWFPNLAPPATNSNKTEETNANFDDEKPNGDNDSIGEEERRKKERQGYPNYPLVNDVVSILNRTKHFISSAHLPLLLIVLDILRLSLHFVRNYEDELLPMIHQNWHGLVRLFDVGNVLLDSQKIILVKAIEVVLCICKLSKDFVYWKIVHEFLPRAISLMQILLKESQNLGKLYAQTTTYKLQCALLDGLPAILDFTKVASEHFRPLEDGIAVYAREEKLPQKLREKASTALNYIEKLKK